MTQSATPSPNLEEYQLIGRTGLLYRASFGCLLSLIGIAGCASSNNGAHHNLRSQSQVLGYDSQQGENPGTMSFILASLTATTALGLMVNGSVQLNRGLQLQQHCTNIEFCDGEPLNFKFAAAGTSFALVVPLAIASGFLFRGALRSYRDHRKWHRLKANDLSKQSHHLNLSQRNLTNLTSLRPTLTDAKLGSSVSPSTRPHPFQRSSMALRDHLRLFRLVSIH